MSTFKKYVIYAAAMWSGFFVMGVELLGGRILAPYFGSSIFVWGGIITVFMTCLSLGYLVGGHISRFSPNVSKLGFLIIAEAVLTIPIVFFSGDMLEWLSSHVPDARYGSLLGALMLFGLPTFVSGTISPYSVRLLVSDLQTSGKSAGSLYFASTIGSAAGTIITSFYLVLYFEIDVVLVSLVCASTLVGLSVALVGGRTIAVRSSEFA